MGATGQEQSALLQVASSTDVPNFSCTNLRQSGIVSVEEADLPVAESRFQYSSWMQCFEFLLWTPFGIVLALFRLLLLAVIGVLACCGCLTFNQFLDIVCCILGCIGRVHNPFEIFDVPAGTLIAATHEWTFDLSVAQHALRKAIGVKARIVVHPKVRSSPLVRLAPKDVDEALVPPNFAGSNFLEACRSWVQLQGDMPLIVAPSGLTVAPGFVTTWPAALFKIPGLTIIPCRINSRNVFGLNLRTCTGSLLVDALLLLMIPMTRCSVTLYQPIQSIDNRGDEEAICLVEEIVMQIANGHQRVVRFDPSNKDRLTKHLLGQHKIRQLQDQAVPDGCRIVANDIVISTVGVLELDGRINHALLDMVEKHRRLGCNVRLVVGKGQHCGPFPKEWQSTTLVESCEALKALAEDADEDRMVHASSHKLVFRRLAPEHASHMKGVESLVITNDLTTPLLAYARCLILVNPNVRDRKLAAAFDLVVQNF